MRITEAAASATPVGSTSGRSTRSVFGAELAAAAGARAQAAAALSAAPATEGGEAKTYYVEGGPTLIEQFGDKLLHCAARPDHTMVILPKENTVCFVGHAIGGEQTVYAEYTADSAEEDPKVRILCHSRNGLFEFTRRIHEIDPRNCSYAELAALHGHLQKTGQEVPDHGELGPLPSGYEIGSYIHRQDFVKGLADLSRTRPIDPALAADAADLSRFYAEMAKVLFAALARSLEGEEGLFGELTTGLALEWRTMAQESAAPSL